SKQRDIRAYLADYDLASRCSAARPQAQSCWQSRMAQQPGKVPHGPPSWLIARPFPIIKATAETPRSPVGPLDQIIEFAHDLAGFAAMPPDRIALLGTSPPPCHRAASL